MKVHPYVYVGLNNQTQATFKKSKHNNINPDTVLKIVSKKTGVSVNEILSRSRIREVSDARQMFCYIMREKYGMRYAKIGRIIGRDHATAIHSCKSHKDKCDVEREYRELTKITCELVRESEF
jgi:chromosomal replication initiator protein